MTKTNVYLFNKRRNKSFLIYLSNLIIYFLAVSSIFTPIRIFPNINQIISILIISWFILSFIDSQKFFLKPTYHNLAIYLFILYTVIVPYFMNNGVIGNRFLGLAQLPLFYLAYQKNKRDGNQKLNYQIIIGVIPFIIITSFLTIRAYALDPLVSRKIKQTALGFELMREGIGGYEFIYFLVILLGILLYIIPNKRNNIYILNKKYRITGYFFIVIISINIILSNYSTALYLWILIVFIRLFVPNIIEHSKMFFIFIFIFIFVTISQLFILQILDLLIDYSGNSLNTMRFIGLKDYFINSRMDDAFGGRTAVWQESIFAFFDNPIIGAIQNKISFSDWGLTGFGQHSQIFDTFALFGFAIGILQLYIYIKPFTLRIKKKKGIYSGLPILLLLVTIILFSVNNATPSIGFALFFIFPTVYDWSNETI